MKKIFFILVIISFFIACGNDDDTYVPELKLSMNECVLNNENQYALVQVLDGGDEQYKIRMSEEGVVKVTRLWGSSKFYIIALKKGNVDVTITNENNVSSYVRVSVSDEIKNIEVTSDIVYIKLNDEKEIHYPQYINTGMVSLSNSYILRYDPIYEKKKVWIKGIALGKAQLSIYNAISSLNHIFDIHVVEAYDLILSRGDTNLDVYNRDYYFHIYSGNGGYKVESSDAGIGSCELLEYNGEKTLAILSNPATIKVTPHKAGAEFVIKVKDSEGKESSVNISTGFFVAN